MDFEYKVKISGDTTNLEKALKIINGQAKKLEDDEILIKIGYDGNYKEFYKVISKIYKDAPEIGIKFQYDLNKKALEVEKQKLSDMEISADTSKLKNEIISLTGQLDKLTSVDFNEIDEDAIDAVTKKLEKLYVTYVDKFGDISDFPKKIQDDLSDLVDLESAIDNIEPIKIDEKALIKQRNIVSEIEENLKKLEGEQEKLNASFENKIISIDNTQATEAIQEVKEKLDELPDNKTVSINVRDYNTAPLLSDEKGEVVNLYRGVTSAWSGLINDKGVSFFTDKLELAADYADTLAEDGKVIKANFALINPLEIEGNGASWDKIQYDGIERTTDEIVEIARQLGHDGVIFKNISDGFGKTEDDISNVIVALNEGVIKNQEVIGNVKAGTGVFNEFSHTQEGVVDKLNQETIAATLAADAESELNSVKKENLNTNNFTSPTTDMVDTISISNEIPILDELKQKLEDVRKAIQAKTEEFEREEQAVNGYIKGEIDDLHLLISTLSEVQSFIESISADLNNVTTGKVKISLPDVDKLDEKIIHIYNTLDDFANSLNKINFNNNFIQQINELLSKSEELKSLAIIIKSSKSDIEKAKKTANSNKKDPQIEKAKNAYKTLIAIYEKYEKLRNKATRGTITSSESGELAKLKVQYDAAQKDLSEIGDEIKNNTKYQKEFELVVKQTNAAINAYNISEDKNINSNLKNELNSLIKKSESMSKDPKYTKGFQDQLSDAARIAKEALNGTNIEMEKSISILKNLNKSATKFDLESTYTGLQKLNLDIEDILKKNTAMSPALKKQFKELGNSIKSALSTGNFEEGDKALTVLKQKVIELKAEMIRTGQDGLSWVDKLKNQARSLWERDFARYFGLNDIIRYIRQISSVVIELDSAMTELRKVSDVSDDRLKQSFQESTRTAKELGSTISDVITVTSDWSRLGYEVDEAEELARVTTLFKNVGDNMSAENASSYMVSTLQGFELTASRAEEIADKFNEVANNYAIDTEGIGEALKRSAASFNAANTDLSQSIALITATNAVVQDPESVGTMWKTVSARIRGAKTELENMGEDTEGMVESTSKLRDLVKGMTGFDIMEDEDTFKSIYDIIVGIGEKWGDLSDIDQAALLESLAGKRAGNALAATLNNIDTLKDAYITAENSAGSAMKEQENYEKSIQYSIDKFKASLQELYSDILDSNFLKELVEFGTKLINILDEIIKKNGSIIPILGTASAIFGGSKLVKTINDISGVLDKINGKDSKGLARENPPSTKLARFISAPEGFSYEAA